MTAQPLTTGSRCQPTPPVSEPRIEEAAFDGAAVVLLADGEDSGDAKATYVLYVIR